MGSFLFAPKIIKNEKEAVGRKFHQKEVRIK